MEDRRGDKSEAREKASRRRPRRVSAAGKKAGAALPSYTGGVVGRRAVDRAANAGMVADVIGATHTAQVARAGSRSDFLKKTTQKIGDRASVAAKEGLRAGGREQIKGHFHEVLDRASYNAAGRLSKRRMVGRTSSTNPAYDASRFVRGKFAGGVQQKSSAAGVRKAISQIEKAKPGSAAKATIRVPRDKVLEARRIAAGRIRVKAMSFTSKEAGKKLDRGLKDLARRGSKATSKTRAVTKGATTGAVMNVVIGCATDAGALKRGELSRRDFAELRSLDAAEGATIAAAGAAASTAGAAAATAALGTAAGASVAGSLGAAGTACVGAISGMGSVGAAAGAVLGTVTVANAAPFIVAGGALVVTGLGLDELLADFVNG